MAETVLRAGIYGRQSHGKETSVENQVRIGHTSCAALGADVTKVYRDRVSASRFGKASGQKREDWPLLVADVAAGELDVIWLWDISRGDRTPESWFAFLDGCRTCGVLIHSERDRRTYDVRVPRDWKTLADSGVDAAYESEIRSVDVRRGVADAALEGKPHGRAPFGYKRVYDQNDRKKFTQVADDNAPIAQAIIERVARRDPLIAIVRDLNAQSIPAPNGGKWERNLVRRLVGSPTYAGLRRHSGTLHTGNWGGLVTASTWERANAVLREPGRKTTAPGRFRWLLSYLAAAPCGSVLNAHPERTGRAARYRCLSDSCSSIGVFELDEFVTDAVLGYLVRPEARHLFDNGDEVAEAARAEVTRLTARLDEARGSFAAPDGISAVALAQLERTIEPMLAAARKRAADVSASAVWLLLDDETFTARTARPRWDALSIAARRGIVSAVAELIVIRQTDSPLSRWATVDDRLEAAAARTAITWRTAA